MPRRFASLSERLSMQNGVLLMGSASLLLLLYTHGSVAALVVMYSINDFLTFSLSQLGMIVFFLKNKKMDPGWRKHLSVHVIGFLVCITILTGTVLIKFREGGWVTIAITAGVVGLCCLIRYHYRKVMRSTQSLNAILEAMPAEEDNKVPAPDPGDMTAILLVGGFGGFGLHSVLAIYRLFSKVFKNYIFVSVGEIDSGTFKGASGIEALRNSVRQGLEKYVRVAHHYGFPADYRMEVGTDVVETATQLCKSVFKEYPHAVVFAGKLIFQKENVFQKVLHNETAFAIQRRLQWDGIAMMILPIRVWF
jgi:K+ transporter